MRAMIVPLLIAVLPLIGLATLQFALPVLAPLLTTAVGRTPESYGVMAGAMGLGSMWFYVANHAVTPALGPLGTLRAGLLIAIAGVALVLTGAWPAMLAGALMIGFGYATTTPAGSQILADFTPRGTWGTLFSLRQAGVPAGGIAAGALGVWIVADHGWRGVLEAIMVALGGIVLVLAAMPGRYNDSRPRTPFVARKLLDPASLSTPFTLVRRTPGLTSLVAGSFGLGVVHITVTSFFVTYLTTGLGMRLATAAGLFAVLQVLAIAGRVGFGIVADRVGSPLSVLRVLAPLSAISALVLSQFSPDWPPAMQFAAVTLIGLTVGTWNGLYLAEIARLAPAGGVSEATAAAGFFTFFAYMITPPIVGWSAANFGYRATFASVAGAALVSGLILAWRGNAEPVDDVSAR